MWTQMCRKLLKRQRMERRPKKQVWRWGFVWIEAKRLLFKLIISLTLIFFFPRGHCQDLCKWGEKGLKGEMSLRDFTVKREILLLKLFRREIQTVIWESSIHTMKWLYRVLEIVLWPLKDWNLDDLNRWNYHFSLRNRSLPKSQRKMKMFLQRLLLQQRSQKLRKLNLKSLKKAPLQLQLKWQSRPKGQQKYPRGWPRLMVRPPLLKELAKEGKRNKISILILAKASSFRMDLHSDLCLKNVCLFFSEHLQLKCKHLNIF